MSTILDVHNLSVTVTTPAGPREVVSGVSFHISRGQTLALVGESGSGKSMTAFALMRLLPPAARVSAGRVCLYGEDLLSLPEYRMERIRGKRIAMIFQEPQSCLNPVLTVRDQLLEAIRLHDPQCGDPGARAQELLEWVKLPDPLSRLAQYPFELSGGQKQRVMIAIALAARPDLLVADEPTTALDVTIQAQILSLLQELQERLGMGLLLITHDLGVVAHMATDVAVMKAGAIVEQASRDQFFTAARHPYSRQLFAVLPGWDSRGHFLGQEGRGPLPPTVAVPEAAPALEIDGLTVHFPVRRGLFKRRVGAVKAVDGITLRLPRGRTLALVGESGCGKTTAGRAVVGLLTPTAGEIRIDGRPVDFADAHDVRRVRERIQVIFQDPYASLNPRMSVGEILEEGIRNLRPGWGAAQRSAKVRDLLLKVGLPEDAVARYPHEFSGGQKQRIAIARALAVEPQILILDEPTSALDVSVQAQILDLLATLQAEQGLSYLFITHNLAVVEHFAHAVAVMYLGRIVEEGEVADVLRHPRHPYTQALLAAVPVVTAASVPLPDLAGDLPSPANPPAGCHFQGRCDRQQPECATSYPEWSGTDHRIRCHLYGSRERPPD